MNESIDDLTVQYEENGQVLINELDKVVLSKGAWTTNLFRYQQWRPETDDYGPDKYVIRRYKKSGGEYRQQDAEHHAHIQADDLPAKLADHAVTFSRQ